MKKNSLLSLLFISILFLSGCDEQVANQEVVLEKKVVSSEDSASSSNSNSVTNSIVSDKILENNFVRNVCNKKNERGAYSKGVYKCGEYYAVYAERTIADAQSLRVNKEGVEITRCGGMRLPETTQVSKECDVACENINLCAGIEISCSSTDGDGCWLENAARMNDKKYCNFITDEYFKNTCLQGGL